MVADYDINDSTFKAVIYNNNATPDTPMAEVSEKAKDLCLADLYMSIATSSSKSGNILDSDGGWQKSRSVKNVTDRGWFRDQANRLYKKWNSDKASSYGKMTLKNLF